MEKKNYSYYQKLMQAFAGIFGWVAVLFFIGAVNAQTTPVTYNSGSGNFNVAGVTAITVEAWGGGGAGGGSTSNNQGGSGGGAGGYVYRADIPVTVPVPYTVGAGGAGSTGSGGSGGNTTIAGLTAFGGTGGGSNRGPVGVGGTASGGTINQQGASGQVGGSSGGYGGSAYNGGIGGGGGLNVAGGTGQAPGGGGGGGERYQGLFSGENRAGGNGGSGRIRITYTTPPTINNISGCHSIGSNVVVTGSNFSPTGSHPITSVTINGVPAASFTIISDTQLTVTIPAGATTGPIRINKNGAFAQTTSNIQIAPTLPAITGPNTVCVGGSINLSHSTSGGSWSTSNSGIATVTSGGVVTGHATGAVTITYSVTSGGCTSPATRSINVTGAPVLSGPSSICVTGPGATFTASTGAGIWSSSNPSVATIDATTGQVTPVSIGTTTIHYTSSLGCPSSTALTVETAPTFINQPTSTSACLGQSASFSVTADGPVSYQWYFNGSPLSNGAGISGATSATLNINPVTAANIGTYHAEISNSCDPVASHSVSLLLIDTPQIGNYTVSTCSGSAFSLNPVNGNPDAMTVVPAGTTYSWSAPVVTGGMTGGAAGSGESLVFGTLINTTSQVQTATYTVTPQAAMCPGEPFTVTVSVSPIPSVLNYITQACNGVAFDTAPVHGGGNVIPDDTVYSWSAPVVSGGMTGGAAGSGSSITGTLNNTTSVMQTATYTVTASNSCGNSTFTLTVTVTPQPTVAGTPDTQTGCSGTPISTITISNPNAIPGFVTYTWTRDNLANVTGMPAGGVGETINGTLINNTGVAQVVNFTLMATSEDGCESAPYVVSVTVLPIPIPTATPMSQTVCAGTGTEIIFGTTQSMPGVIFNWTRNNPAVGGLPMDGTGDIQTSLLTNSTSFPQTVTFTVTADLGGCSTTIDTVTLTVNPQPSVAGIPLYQTVCGGTAITPIVISNPNNVPGTTFTWTRDNTANVTGIAASGTTQTITGTLVNVTAAPQTVTFTLRATAGGCQSFTTTVSVEVNPSPILTVTPASQTICSGSNATVTFNNTNSVPGTTYSWVRTNTGNVTGVAASGTGNVITGTFNNPTSTLQTTTFTMTATAPGGCTQVLTATVSVYPAVVAPVIGANQVVCVNQQPTPIVMTSVPTGGTGTYTYQWQSSPSGNAGTWTNISGATGPTYQPPQTNSNTPQIYYHLVVTACGTQYTSNTVSVVVANNQNFSFDIEGGSGTFCSGSTFNPYIGSLNAPWVRLRYAYTADGNYVTPAIGEPVGGYTNLFLVALSYANLSMTVQNNTNANVTTNVYLTPWVYNNSSGAFICTLSPEVLTISIRPRPTATILSQPTEMICSNSPISIVIDGNITDAQMNFSWTRIDGNSNVVSTSPSGSVSGLSHPANSFTINDNLTNNSSSIQTVIYRVTPYHAACGTLPGTPVEVHVQVAPRLLPGTVGTSHSVCAWGDPSLLTELTPATGVNLTYQWESAPTAAGPWLPIPFATSATYDPPFGITSTTYYRRVVTSTVGGTVCSVANTVPVVVTVNDMTPGEIGNDQTVCEGQIPAAIISTVPATFTGGVQYMWQSSPNDFGPWTPMGVTTANLTFAAPLAQTTYFKRITTSFHGGSNCADETNVVAVIVNQVTGGTIGDDQMLCGGSNNPSLLYQLTPATGTGTLTYQWQSSTAADCNSGWSNISGVAAQGMNYDPPAGVSVTTRYRRVTTSTINGVACSAVSNCITVTANPVTGGAISGNRTVCMGGDPAAFTVLTPSTGPNLTYQWQMSTVSGVGPWTDISGATSATYDAPGPINQTTYYQRLTFSTVGSDTCSAASNFVTVFVNEVTPATYLAGSGLCAGENPPAFTIVTPASAPGAITYQWQSSTVGCAGPWTNIAGATSATYDPPVLSQTMYYQVITTSTLNGVACSAISACVQLSFNGKMWNGSVSQNWDVAANWTPAGVPTSGHCVVIPPAANSPRVLGSGSEAFARSLTVLNGGNLRILAGNTIVVEEAVDVQGGGTFHLESSASLVQNTNAANSGIMTIERTTTPMYKFDYTYWNSPVQMGTYTLGNLSPNTQYDKYYSWNPSVGGGYGNWVQESAATVMNPLKGYIVRAPNSFSSTPTVFTPYTATFTGVANNGDIHVPIGIGSMGAGTTDDKLNLIGNPYPSAIDADLLLNDAHNAGMIEGTLYFWTHHAPPSAANPNPFYGTFTLNYSPEGYAVYNATGSTGTAPSDYAQAPDGYIASGQSFFAIGKQNGTLNITNAMRVRGNNNTFFRPAGELLPSAPERHRVWLNFANEQGLFSQTLVGYVQGATNAVESKYDGPTMADGFVLYSIADGTALSIQGRGMPFSADDLVPMGYSTTGGGQYTIGIDRVDGLFENQNIFLEDKLLGIVHDLKASAYTFTTVAGRFDDRFVLKYSQAQLGVDTLAAGQYIAFIAEGMLNITTQSDIRKVYVYDMTGKRIKEYSPEYSSSVRLPFNAAEGVYMIKIHLQGGEVLSGKVSN